MKKQANICSTVWTYQWKQLIRNRVLLFSFGVLMLSAIYSAYYGRDFVGRQRAMIGEADSLDRARQAKSHERFMQRLDKEGVPADDPRRQRFDYRPSNAYFPPADFAALAIGQKDNLPFLHPVHRSPQSIYSVSSTDIQNPSKLLAGNFDLSFIILYLLPLLIIVYGYGLRSEEVEQGTYTLVRVQADANSMLRRKWLFRCLVVCLFMILLNLVAFSLAGIPVMDQWSQKTSWLLATVVYTVFWFSLVWLIVRICHSGPLAALLLGGLWVLLLLVVPTLVYRYVSHPQEKEQVKLLFNRRGDFPKAGELAPEVLTDSFARLKHPIALPTMSDTSEAMQRTYRTIRVGEIQTRFDNGLGRRVMDVQAVEYQRTLVYNWVNPVYAVQHAFNQIGGTEINLYHDYIAELENYGLMQRYARYQHVLETKSSSGWSDDVGRPYAEYKLPSVGPGQALWFILPVIVLAFGFFAVGALRRNE